MDSEAMERSRTFERVVERVSRTIKNRCALLREERLFRLAIELLYRAYNKDNEGFFNRYCSQSCIEGKFSCFTCPKFYQIIKNELGDTETTQPVLEALTPSVKAHNGRRKNPSIKIPRCCSENVRRIQNITLKKVPPRDDGTGLLYTQDVAPIEFIPAVVPKFRFTALVTLVHSNKTNEKH